MKPGQFFPSVTCRHYAPEGTVFTRVAYENDEPRHVYVRVGKAGSALASVAAGLSRVVSGNLQNGSTLEEVGLWLVGNSHDRPAPTRGSPAAASVADAVGQALLSLVGEPPPPTLVQEVASE